MENHRNKLLQLLTPKPANQKRKRRNEEASHQAALFKWLSLWDKNVRAVTFHIPNGGSRDPIEAKSLKRQGVTSGVPDIFMSIPNLHYHGLFIEMKSKDGKINQIQQQMHAKLKLQGYLVAVCYDWFNARETIMEYLKQRKGTDNVECIAV